MKETKGIQDSILINAAKCMNCCEIIESTKENYAPSCSCGNIMISGALDQEFREVTYPDMYTNMTVRTGGNSTEVMALRNTIKKLIIEKNDLEKEIESLNLLLDAYRSIS